MGGHVTRSVYVLTQEQETQSEREELLYGGYCELFNFSILDTQV